MTIRYESTMDDVYHFNEYLNFHIPRLRRWFTIARFATVATVALLLPILGPLLVHQPLSPTHYIVTAIITAIVFAYYHLIWRYVIRRQAQQMAKLGAYKSILGMNELTIAPDGLHGVSPIGNSHYKWDAVEQVIKSDTHLFLMFSESFGAPIPKRAFTDAAHEAAFLAEVERYRAGAIATPAPVASHRPTSATHGSNAPWWTGHSTAENTPQNNSLKSNQ